MGCSSSSAKAVETPKSPLDLFNEQKNECEKLDDNGSYMKNAAYDEATKKLFDMFLELPEAVHEKICTENFKCSHVTYGFNLDKTKNSARIKKLPKVALGWIPKKFRPVDTKKATRHHVMTAQMTSERAKQRNSRV